jgi:hypothetical protein
MSEEPTGSPPERIYEKAEKQEEKEEKERHEKDWEEKWQHDPLSGAVWALILIWAGVAFLAETIGLLARLNLPRLGAWDLIFTGAGLVVLAEVIIRVLVPAYRRPVTGTLILAFVLLAIGIGGVIGEGIVWPLVLIAVGVGILLRVFLRR